MHFRSFLEIQLTVGWKRATYTCMLSLCFVSVVPPQPLLLIIGDSNAKPKENTNKALTMAEIMLTS